MNLAAVVLLGAVLMVLGPTPIAAQTKADPQLPDVGLTFVTRNTNHQDSSSSDKTWTVVEATHKGRKVIGFSDGVDTFLHNADRNWFMTVRGSAERASATPHDGMFSAPLEVGRTWTASYMYYDGVTRRTFNPVVAHWRAAAFEDVTVPAGTFKAFRLESSPGTNNATSLTVWYAPDVRLIVKRILERTAQHYLGPGRFTTELVRIGK